MASIYDKSVDYISGGQSIPDIKEFFWKWERRHYSRTESSLDKYEAQIIKPGEITMQPSAPSALRRLMKKNLRSAR